MEAREYVWSFTGHCESDCGTIRAICSFANASKRRAVEPEFV
jgi:hypothetical protein